MTSFLGLCAYAIFCYALGWWMCERKHEKDAQEARLAKIEEWAAANNIPIENQGREHA